MKDAANELRKLGICACQTRCTNRSQRELDSCPKCQLPKHATCGIKVPKDNGEIVYWCFECKEGPSLTRPSRVRKKRIRGQEEADQEEGIKVNKAKKKPHRLHYKLPVKQTEATRQDDSSEEQLEESSNVKKMPNQSAKKTPTSQTKKKSNVPLYEPRLMSTEASEPDDEEDSSEEEIKNRSRARSYPPRRVLATSSDTSEDNSQSIDKIDVQRSYRNNKSEEEGPQSDTSDQIEEEDQPNSAAGSKCKNESDVVSGKYQCRVCDLAMHQDCGDKCPCPDPKGRCDVRYGSICLKCLSMKCAAEGLCKRQGWVLDFLVISHFLFYLY